MYATAVVLHVNTEAKPTVPANSFKSQWNWCLASQLLTQWQVDFVRAWSARLLHLLCTLHLNIILPHFVFQRRYARKSFRSVVCLENTRVFTLDNFPVCQSRNPKDETNCETFSSNPVSRLFLCVYLCRSSEWWVLAAWPSPAALWVWWPMWQEPQIALCLIPVGRS